MTRIGAIIALATGLVAGAASASGANPVWHITKIPAPTAAAATPPAIGSAAATGGPRVSGAPNVQGNLLMGADGQRLVVKGSRGIHDAVHLRAGPGDGDGLHDGLRQPRHDLRRHAL